MESEDGAPATGQQPPPIAAEEGAPASDQEPDPMGDEEGEPIAVQRPEPMVAEEGETIAVQRPELLGDEEREPTAAQQPEPMVSVSAAGSALGRSRSAPPSLQSHPAQLHPEAIPGSSSGSSYISNATDVTNISSSGSSDVIFDRRCNGHFHSNGSGTENGASESVPSAGTLRPETGSQMESEPSLSTGVTPGHEETHSGKEPVSRKDSDMTTSTSSMSLNFSASTSSSSSDPTKPNILGLRSSSVLDTDEDDTDEAASLTSLMNLVEVYSDYFDDVEQKQTEEYIISVIKGYMDMASISIGDLRIIATRVLDSDPLAEPSGDQVTDEKDERAELCTRLERRLQAVRDYVKSATEDTTEDAISKMILEEYNAEMLMAESDMFVVPFEETGSAAQAGTSGVHDVEGQEIREIPDEKVSFDGQLAQSCVKDLPSEGLPAEETGSSSQVASGGVKQDDKAASEEGLPTSKECVQGTIEASEASSSSSSSYNSRERREYALSSHYEQVYPETERQRKFRKSRQEAVVLKIFSMAQARVYGIRAMNSVMLSCLKTVMSIVKQALEANRVALRVASEAAELQSAGSSGDYVAAMTETATAASQCAETAVREIEEAVQLHKLVVEALKLAERTLYNIKTETCDGADLIRHLVAGVELIEVQVSRACKTYLDAAKDKDSADDSPLVLPTRGGIHGPVVSMAFDNIEDGPSDVFQALLWASQSSVNAMEMIVKGLQDFSIEKLRLPYKVRKQ